MGVAFGGVTLLRSAVLRVVGAQRHLAVNQASKMAMSWNPETRFEVAEGEFAVVLTGCSALKDQIFNLLSFAEKFDDVDVYFQGRLTGRVGKFETVVMQAQVRVLGPGQLDKVAGLEPDPKSLLTIIDFTVSSPCVSSDNLLRFVRRECKRGSAVILLTPNPSLALEADSVYRLGKSGIQSI